MNQEQIETHSSLGHIQEMDQSIADDDLACIETLYSDFRMLFDTIARMKRAGHFPINKKFDENFKTLVTVTDECLSDMFIQDWNVLLKSATPRFNDALPSFTQSPTKQMQIAAKSIIPSIPTLADIDALKDPCGMVEKRIITNPQTYTDNNQPL